MKRGWLVVLANILPVIGLQLAVRAMETAPPPRERKSGDDGGPGPVIAGPVPSADAEPVPETDGGDDDDDEYGETVEVHHPSPAVERAARWSFETAAAQSAHLVEPPGGLPAFLAEEADSYTQLYRGYTRPGWLTFALYSDGTLRMVDIDGRGFSGRLIGTSATLRESDATSSFEVAFTVAGPNGRRRVAFCGGRHDAQELEIEPFRKAPTASR